MNNCPSCGARPQDQRYVLLAAWEASGLALCPSCIQGFDLRTIRLRPRCAACGGPRGHGDSVCKSCKAAGFQVASLFDPDPAV
jgi:hypothetical protein